MKDKTEDLSKCPVCDGEADNGHDRELPPNPYVCTKCETKTEDKDTTTTKKEEISSKLVVDTIEELVSEFRMLKGHEITKLTDGFGHPKDCVLCGGAFNEMKWLTQALTKAKQQGAREERLKANDEVKKLTEMLEHARGLTELGFNEFYKKLYDLTTK